MKKLCFNLLFFLFISVSLGQTKVFINEIHYDNDGTDTNEGIEISGPSGLDLSDYALTLYNGNNSEQYRTINLSGTIPSSTSGFGAIFFNIAGLQNGAPDGVALSNNGTLIQFLIYEGTITAKNGVAAGQTSTDIGVSESNSSTPVGHSLQLSGTGTTYEDFTWSGPSDSSYNAVNPRQTFSSTAGHEDFAFSEVKLYPNPNSVGHFKLSPLFKAPISIKIYNTTGQLVMGVSVYNGMVDVQKLNPGMYLVELTKNNQNRLTKLIIN